MSKESKKDEAKPKDSSVDLSGQIIGNVKERTLRKGKHKHNWPNPAEIQSSGRRKPLMLL